MYKLPIAVFLILILFPFYAQSEVIRQEKTSIVDVSGSITPDYDFDLFVSVSFKPVAVFSSLSVVNPITLVVSCDEDILGKREIYYSASLKDKEIQLDLVIRSIQDECKTKSVTISLDPNGVELIAGSTFEKNSIEIVGKNIDLIKRERAQKQIELVNTIMALSNAAGSKEAVYCAIDFYKFDLSDTDANRFKQNYNSLYGSYDAAGISCPLAARGVLASEVSECVAEPRSLAKFCLIYSRYLRISKWYQDSIDRLEQIGNRLDDNSNSLWLDADKTKKDLEAEIKAQQEQMTES